MLETVFAGPANPLAQSAFEDNSLGGVEASILQSRFGSYHLGVCQFVMCDGHVQALRTTINPTILGYLAARNDRNHIPDF